MQDNCSFIIIKINKYINVFKMRINGEIDRSCSYAYIKYYYFTEEQERKRYRHRVNIPTIFRSMY